MCGCWVKNCGIEWLCLDLAVTLMTGDRKVCVNYQDNILIILDPGAMISLCAVVTSAALFGVDWSHDFCSALIVKNCNMIKIPWHLIEFVIQVFVVLGVPGIGSPIPVFSFHLAVHVKSTKEDRGRSEVSAVIVTTRILNRTSFWWRQIWHIHNIYTRRKRKL